MGNKENFINKSNKKFNNKFNYDKFVYINAKIKGIIICEKHGEFLQNPDKHLNSIHGCRECWFDYKNKHSKDWVNPNKTSLTKIKNKKEEFVKLCKEKHGNKFKYDLSDYKSFTIGKIKIICPIHGETFQVPKNHLVSGTGCWKCGNEKKNKSKTKSIENFLLLVNKKHNNKYLFPYINDEYKNRKSKITVMCEEHGEFIKSGQKLLAGQGCFRCNIDELVKNNKLVGLYKNKLFNRKPELANKDGVFYYLSINNGEFFKIGITSTDLKLRIKSIRSNAKKNNYIINNVSVIYSEKTTLCKAYCIEQVILKYHSNIRVSEKWSSELFISDIRDNVRKM